MRLRYSSLNLPVIFTMLTALSCIVPSGDTNDGFSFSLAATSDTLAPFGTITIVFSEPVADSPSVRFFFSPPFYSHTTTSDSGSDTFTITLSEPLAGGDRYVIRIDKTINSIRGAEMTPDDDSAVLFTYATEREPNGDTATADALTGRMFGTITTTDDTDCYRIEDRSVTSVFLISYGSQTTFGLCDADDDSIVFHAYTKNDTVPVSSSALFPLRVTVYARQKSVGGYYEIGVINSTSVNLRTDLPDGIARLQ